MPVADHPVHPSTRIGADFRYGCWNRERKPGYWAPDREYTAAGRFVVEQRFIPDTATLDCHHSSNDPACSGCKWRK